MIHHIGDLLEHSLYTGQHLVVPEPENPITGFIQKLSPPLISLNLISMMCAIEFDYQSVLRAEEVHDVTPDWLLATELKAIHLPVAQAHPQFALGVGVVTTQALGVGTER